MPNKCFIQQLSQNSAFSHAWGNLGSGDFLSVKAPMMCITTVNELTPTMKGFIY